MHSINGALEHITHASQKPLRPGSPGWLPLHWSYPGAGSHRGPPWSWGQPGQSAGKAYKHRTHQGACTHTLTHTPAHIRAHKRTNSERKHAHKHAHTHKRTHLRIHTNTCTHTHTHTHMHTYTHTHTHSLMHKNTRTNIHMDTDRHTHTHRYRKIGIWKYLAYKGNYFVFCTTVS